MSAVHPAANRTRATYRCLSCGKEFHPFQAAGRLYCSNRCRTDGVAARGRVYKRVEEAAKDGSLTDAEIVATLRAIPRDPILIEDEEVGEDG